MFNKEKANFMRNIAYFLQCPGERQKDRVGEIQQCARVEGEPVLLSSSINQFANTVFMRFSLRFCRGARLKCLFAEVHALFAARYSTATFLEYWSSLLFASREKRKEHAPS